MHDHHDFHNTPWWNYGISLFFCCFLLIRDMFLMFNVHWEEGIPFYIYDLWTVLMTFVFRKSVPPGFCLKCFEEFGTAVRIDARKRRRSPVCWRIPIVISALEWVKCCHENMITYGIWWYMASYGHVLPNQVHLLWRFFRIGTLI